MTRSVTRTREGWREGGLTLDEAVLLLVRELLERLELRLLDEERREDPGEHEEREDLQPARRCQQRRTHGHRSFVQYSQVLDELVRATDVDELAEPDLGNDGAELAARSRDTVRGGPVARRERLPRDDERRRVRPEVLEEVREAVEEGERVRARFGGGEPVVCEACPSKKTSARIPYTRALAARIEWERTHDDEEDGEHGEAHELDGLAAPAVNNQERGPVPGNETRNGDDHVPDGDVLQVHEHLLRARERRVRGAEPDRLEDDRVVEAEAVEGDVEREPRVRRAEQQTAVLPLREVRDKVVARGLGCLCALDDRVGVDVVRAGGEEVLDVLSRLLHVALDVHREPGRLGDSETEVEGDRAGDTAETDQDTPHEVDVLEDGRVVVQKRVLVCGDDDERNKGSSWRDNPMSANPQLS